MKLAIVAAAVAVLVAGCAGINRVTDLGSSPDVVHVTPEIVDEQHEKGIFEGAKGVMRAIRTACRRDGHFKFDWYGVEEEYVCVPIQDEGTLLETGY